MSAENAERLLRDALRDLAGDPQPPSDLLTVAMTRGRRIRRTRRITGVAAAFVAVAAIAAPYVWLRPDSPRPAYPIAGPPATEAASPPETPGVPSPTVSDWTRHPVELPGGWILVGATSSGAAGISWVYDRSRQRYIDLSSDYSQAWAAPQGRFAAVRRNGLPNQTGLLDIPTGQVKWYSTADVTLPPQWSPDGKRLLLTLSDRVTGAASYAILAIGSRDLQQYRTRSVSADSCAEGCRFTWLPTGKEVVLSQAVHNLGRPRDRPSPSGKRDTSSPDQTLQFFAAIGGRPTRALPLTGNVAGPGSWSPDGSMVVLRMGRSDEGVVMTDKGIPLADLPAADAVWIDNSRLIYVDRRPGAAGSATNGMAAVLVDLKGGEIDRVELPRELAGADEIVFAPE